MRTILIIFLLIISVGNLFSIEYLDTKGKEFWLTFLPNSHKTQTTSTTDSLFIFISAEVATQGQIEYYDRSGTYHNQTFSITNPNSVYTFELQYFNYELWGYKTEYSLDTRYQSETVCNMAFHVTSDNEITVYAHSQAKQTSDAFLVMPTDVLDKNYFVVSYNSCGHYSTSTTGNGPTPSQFAVVGTEDSTVVTIKPKVSTAYNGTAVQKIKLNKGEVYLVQAKIDASNLDLTGTTIDADKPVAVFAGEQKSLIPIYSGTTEGSRDFLMEQIPPTKVWGKNAFITPFKQPSNVTSSYNDIFRIIAAYDSTTIYINNTKIATLSSGGYYESVLTTVGTVTANAPILLTQYKKSSTFTQGNKNGDPFMLVVPPKEQYMNSYRTINVQAWENTGMVYFEQYITIVIPTNSTGSFRLDGTAVNAGQFSAIPGSGYSYANIAVSDGVHSTKADSAFGIYIYGYGYANSFGYTGGMSFAPIDYQPPQISSSDSCYQVSGIVYDSTISDAGIEKCICPDTSKHNCNVNLGNISPDGRILNFSALLIDKRFDGSFTIIATDSTGQTNAKTINIKGFTLGLNGNELSAEPLNFNDKIKVGAAKCYKVPIHNYGKFSQTITKYSLSNRSEFIINPTLPHDIAAGNLDTLTICFKSDVDSTFTDTLSISGDCGDVKILAAFNIQTGHDNLPPNYVLSADSCTKNFLIYIADSTAWDTGIASINILEESNCNIEVLSNQNSTAIVSIKIINSSEDMYYGISILDGGGHELIIRDTIRSGSLKIFANSGQSNNSEKLDFGIYIIGSVARDSIILYNSGQTQITIDDIKLAKNINFSIPQSQFPLILKPQDSTILFIIFHPTIADTAAYLDTLIIDSYCVNQKIILTGYGEDLEFSANSKCDTKLIIKTSKVSDNFSVENVYPNPLSGTGKIVIQNDETSNIIIDLYSYTGDYLMNFLNKELPVGQYEQTISTDGLCSGVYFIKITKNNNTIIKSMIVSE